MCISIFIIDIYDIMHIYILIFLYSMSKKKKGGNPGLTQIFSKSKKDITKLISVHDSIIILLSFGALFIHIRPLIAAQQSVLWNMSKLFLSKLALLMLHDGICGSFHNKATIHASALHCVTNSNLDKDNFDMLYKIIAEQPSLINDQCTIWKKNKYAIIYW